MEILCGSDGGREWTAGSARRRLGRHDFQGIAMEVSAVDSATAFHVVPAPAIPRSHGHVGRPEVGDPQASGFVRRLPESIDFLHPHAHYLVVVRKNVRPAQRENQEYFGGPHSDSFYRY